MAYFYSYLITSNVPDVKFELRLYVGTDAAEHFLSSPQNDLNTHIMPLIERDVDMVFDHEAQERFNSATGCYIYNKPLNSDKNIISQDHIHFTGHFRGPVHQTCNLKFKIDKKQYKMSILTKNQKSSAFLILQVGNMPIKTSQS